MIKTDLVFFSFIPSNFGLTFYFLGLGTIRREREREISGYTEKQNHFRNILSRWEIQKWYQVYR